MSDSFTIRTMSPADVGRAIDWAAAEGWNPGLSDADCFAAVDADGFMGGWLGARLIASISVVNYDSRFAFLGFYIVDSSHRGRGYGYRLWRHAVRHAGERLVGLDGVLAEQDTYRRSGFELAYRNIRYGGTPSADMSRAPCPAGLKVTSLDRLTPETAAFDRRMFPAPREAFLEAWVSAPGHVPLVAHRDGKLAGFGVIRPCRNGHKIGPLFADDRPAAEALLMALLKASGINGGSGEVFLDVPEPNRPGLALARDLGLKPVFETARMYTGPAPQIDLGRIFGVTSFELG
ncbi:MAG: GNAT family N-acetyltransferase [Rhodospirillales bacterium]|nr:GNAT family N-acetyltransferase [Rhodospirillales bacterium]